MSEIEKELDHVTRLRPAVEGDPTQGPYPATITELADEVVDWINRTEVANAPGLSSAVVGRLIRDRISGGAR